MATSGIAVAFRIQPVVSPAIKLLEEELGEPLFLRLGHTGVLTQAGQVLLEQVTQAFDALEQGRLHISPAGI